MRTLYLFDLDGTLATSDGAGRRAFEQALAEVLGLRRALTGIALHGNTDPLILDQACRRGLGRAADEDETRAVYGRYLAHLAEELACPGVIRLLPGVAPLLDRLAAADALLGLATGNLEAGARLKLDAVGLWERFAVGGYGSDAAERAELVAVGIRRAEARLQRPVPRGEIALIGDTRRDVAAALRVGVRAIGVTTGPDDAAALFGAGAEEVYENLGQFAG